MSPPLLELVKAHVGYALAEGDSGHLHVALHFFGQHTGGIVDQTLCQLAGVGEHLVELLHLLLQVGHDIAAIGTHRVDRQLKRIPSRIGSHRPHQIDKLVHVDERERTAKQVNAAATGAERRRDEGDHVGTHHPVARNHRASRDNTPTLPKMGSRRSGVGHRTEHRVHFLLEVGMGFRRG